MAHYFLFIQIQTNRIQFDSNYYDVDWRLRGNKSKCHIEIIESKQWIEPEWANE